MKKIIIAIFLSVLLPIAAFAAEIFFEAESTSKNGEFLVKVFLHPGSFPLNAIEGNVAFSEKSLTVKEIRDGNSAINFWIAKPDLVSPGVISFSGMTPGGMRGDKSLLFSIFFESARTQDAKISAEEVYAFQNDGLGTKVAVVPTPFSFPADISAGSKEADIEDTDPPEDFVPTIASDPVIFDGKYFVVFATQDKGRGLDYFEVREGLFGKFKEAKSPHLLTHQKPGGKIYVKAVDKAGNSRIVSVKNGSSSWQKPGFIAIIMILIALLLLSLKRKWLKSAK